MKFEQLKKRAGETWKAWDSSKLVRIMVGDATCGNAAGALEVIDVLKDELHKRKIKAEIMRVGCIGLCYLEPLVDIIKPGAPRITYGEIDPKKMGELLDGYVLGDDPMKHMAIGVHDSKPYKGIPPFWGHPMLKPQVRIALKNCGHIDPTDLDHYVAHEGFDGFIKALAMKADDVVQEVKDSGLRGRGGGGFSTGQKWQFCRQQPGKVKYLICNADEGDPGAFMDRSLLEGDPYAVLEGMLIAAYGIGASDGYIYIRAEYPLAIERLKKAISEMEKVGLIGDDILGSGMSFHIKIKEGAGAFVCGEETALIASIEGKRGMPRSRPPFPAVSGLWGKPSNINNVETFGNLAAILRKGAKWYAGFGTETSRGTKTFALAGKVKRTGLIEVPMGIALKEIVFEIGGGILNDKRFSAAQTGGPSGGCIPANIADTKMDYDNLAKVGSIMGSGGLVVMDENTCMVDLARYFLTFTQSESCGKCVPCRLGTKQMLTILEDICAGKGREGDIELLLELSGAIKNGSLCGLGQTAPNPVLTTVKYFREEYEAHIKNRTCPAGVCKDLIQYTILPDACTGCTACARKCPNNAITGEKKKPHVIDQALCIKCGICYETCKFDSIRIE